LNLKTNREQSFVSITFPFSWGSLWIPQGGTAAAPTHAGAAGVGPHGTATIATNPSHYNQVTGHFTIISCQLSATRMSYWFHMCRFL